MSALSHNYVDRLLYYCIIVDSVVQILCCGHYPTNVADITFLGKYSNLYIKPCLKIIVFIKMLSKCDFNF